MYIYIDIIADICTVIIISESKSDTCATDTFRVDPTQGLLVLYIYIDIIADICTVIIISESKSDTCATDTFRVDPTQGLLVLYIYRYHS